MKPRFLNVNQVAQRLNISQRFVYQLIEQGDLPGYRLGNKCGVRVPAEGLERYIESCRIDP